MSNIFGRLFSRKQTPQSEPMPGSAQVKNSAGGYSFAVDDWVRLDRFLILGSEGGSYYASERALTMANAEAVGRCIDADGLRVVSQVVLVSTAGRAPKNDPAIFVLAMCAKLGNPLVRRAALAAVPEVCRIGTHLMHFAEYAECFGGWGRGLRRAVAGWYNNRPVRSLAYQLVKYQSRDGWSNRDLLRLSHARAPTAEHNLLYRWATHGEIPADTAVSHGELGLLAAFEAARKVTQTRELVELIRQHDLPREAIPTEKLAGDGAAAVWEALLLKMPITAMVRNLATMTRVGLLAPGSEATKLVVSRLADEERLRKARLHPIAVLAALMTYQAGRGVRGQQTWTPVGALVDALDGAFYRTFGMVEPSGGRMLFALDVSASMTGGCVAGVPGLTPRVASAAMALVTAAVEKERSFVAFTSELTELTLSPRQRLDDVVRKVDRLSFGATDCAQPMLWAARRAVAVDTFLVYTDSETWFGNVHPVQALREYRQKTGIPAKLVVVGMVSNGFSIADPEDAGMLDVVGFDTATPSVITDFARRAAVPAGA